uniref:SnoaL-like domain-containing protein n=1 Tax=Fusarium oxysporum (strain Fo5176) TaxID=660025 RepID=A0A0D2XR35_FUSOF
MQPPGVISPCQTEQEQRNIDLCKEYMRIAYSPTENKGATSVQHLCHPDSWFWAPATFPGCETPMDYADSHSTVMASVADLKIIRFDQSWAKDGHVLLRYTAQGSHCGEPYKGISKTGRHAQWSAAAIFEVEDGKIRSFTKDWDQKTMQAYSRPRPVSGGQTRTVQRREGNQAARNVTEPHV